MCVESRQISGYLQRGFQFALNLQDLSLGHGGQALLYRLLKQRSDYRENAHTGHGGHGKLNGFEFHGGSACLKVSLSMAYRPAFAKA